MVVKCLNCDEPKELTSFSFDELGPCTTCESCGGSFDIDVEPMVALIKQVLNKKAITVMKNNLCGGI